MKEHFCSVEQSLITYKGSCNWCGESEGSMTQDDVIEMAQECNLIGMRPHLDGIYSEALVAFANLVAAKKQERIIEVVERLGTWAHITEVVAEIRGEA
jgi:hypothetical protein